ncbi:MAG: hypothetical protein A2V65_11450 [Deltaproteobacteria bacterium RBG_13_49_15]|nr:MAG: hypothetical protein A2V65_11450 [Deltaproteobacteria bacterium RBG_13_49_15]
MRNIIFILSYVMAVLSGLAVLFIRNNEKQKMAAIVAALFLLSFFVNIDPSQTLFLKIACIVAFAMAILSGVIGIFSNEEYIRIGSIVVGIVSLVVSLLILFMFLEFRPL